MTDDRENRIKEMVLDHVLNYVRECHGHGFTLTRTVVTLNVVALAVAGALFKLNSGTITAFTDNELLRHAVIFLGFLVASFGIVYNQGASAVHSNLLLIAQRAREYLKQEIGETIKDEFIDQMLNTKKGKNYLLTKSFFIICSTIWFTLGTLLVIYGLGLF